MSGMSIVWEDTDGCVKKYRCALDIYFMTVLSSSYGIIMDPSIHVPCHGKIFFWTKLNGQTLFEGKMELIGKLGSSDNTKIRILTSASKGAYNKISDQCLHILNNKEGLNELKGSTKVLNSESLLKYQ